MKILITTDWYAPTINGVVRSVLNLRENLQRQGHQVRILTLSHSTASFQREDVFFLGSLPAGKLYPGARMRVVPNEKIVKNLIAWRPDVVHSQCEFSTFIFARRIASASNAPLVHTYHTVYENYTHYFSPFKKWGKTAAVAFSRYIASKVDYMIAPTKKTEKILRGYYVDCPVGVVPTGIDLSLFRKMLTHEKEQALREQLSIPDNHRILLHVGRMAEEKNIDELLCFMADLQLAPITLLLVGDGPCRRELENLAVKQGISDHIRFAGMVPPEEIGAYYQISDLFVSASTSETQGLTYIEALASGLPLLCRADPCLDGVIMDGQNGWRYQDKQEFQIALAQFLQDELLRRAMSASASVYSERYSMQMFASRVFDVYRQAQKGREAAEAI